MERESHRTFQKGIYGAIEIHSECRKREGCSACRSSRSDANIRDKQLWERNKGNLIEGLEEIENIKTSKDARRISSLYVSMLGIFWYLREEINKLRDIKSLAKTGKIKDTVGFTNEFAKEFPKQLQFDNSIRLKPEHIRDSCVSQFWLRGNPFHPYDPDTGR